MPTEPTKPTHQGSAASGDVNRMWGGRFQRGADPRMVRLNSSVSDDKRIAVEDIEASQAHVLMLGSCGILSDDEAQTIAGGLSRVGQEIESGNFQWSEELEDVHMNVESRLRELIGDVAGKLHTGRSRNDQVATDMRLWLRRKGCQAFRSLAGLLAVTLDLAQDHAQTLMPGFTHLQVAQPVTFGFTLLAHAHAWARDLDRWQQCLQRMNECPLGAAALAGTSFPIDRHQTAQSLGFSGPMANAMDAVSARDHMVESLSVCTMSAAHLSRLAEDLVIWSMPMVDFVVIDDAFCSGSSIMPQKRNPDAAELIRGKPARMLASLTAMVTLVKGLPMAYCKDLQDDKRMLFLALDDYVTTIEAATGVMEGLQVNPQKMADAVRSQAANATEVADWLVQQRGMNFRDAHHVVGRLVRAAEEAGVSLSDLSREQRLAVDTRLDDEVVTVLDPMTAVYRRDRIGGVAPDRTIEAVMALRQRWQCWQRWLDSFALSAHTDDAGYKKSVAGGR